MEHDELEHGRGSPGTPPDPVSDLPAGQRVTAEVGSEGGSPGDLEVERRTVPGTGSEGTELWHAGPEAAEQDEEIDRVP